MWWYKIVYPRNYVGQPYVYFGVADTRDEAAQQVNRITWLVGLLPYKVTIRRKEN